MSELKPCPKCSKPKVSPDERCDCRLNWQIKKCYELEEKLSEALRERLRLNNICIDYHKEKIKGHGTCYHCKYCGYDEDNGFYPLLGCPIDTEYFCDHINVGEHYCAEWRKKDES